MKKPTKEFQDLVDEVDAKFAQHSSAHNAEDAERAEAEVIPNPEEILPENNTPKATKGASEDMSAKMNELVNDLQRTRADFENFRKQTELQKSQAMAAARFATVEKFLPLVDDFMRAIASYPAELKPLEKNLTKMFKSLGLEVIKSDPGTEFNPDYHEAISIEDGEGDKEVIAEVLRPGYLYEGAVLRAAMVKVTRK